jgi:hypothetical protein
MEPMAERPSTIHAEEGVAPKGPWRFLRRAAPGGFSAWGLHLMAAWVAFQALSSLGLALRLGSAVGPSRAADGWGEQLTARGLWEVMGRGGPAGGAFGPWAIAAAAAAALWAVWAGWKVQAAAAGVAARPGPLLLSVPGAICIGFPPLLALHAFLWGALGFLAESGIQPLAWADFVGSPLLRLCFASSLLLQWWLCRVDLGGRAPEGFGGWLRHMKESSLRLWSHPVQWGAVVFLGVSARAGLSFLVLALAWRLGGQSLAGLWCLCALQALAAAANAWAIGWALRTTALFWRNDAEVRSIVGELESGRG